MLTGLVAALGKDLRLLARARVGLVFLALAPSVVISVAGLSLATLYGAEPGGGTAPVLPLADEDGGWVGRAVRERLTDEPSVRVRRVATAAAAGAVVQAKRAAAALVVPAGTSDAVAAGRAAALVLLTDPVKTVDVAYVRGLAQELRHGLETAAVERAQHDLDAARAQAADARAGAADDLHRALDDLGARLEAMRADTERRRAEAERGLRTALAERQAAARARLVAALVPLRTFLAELAAKRQAFAEWLAAARERAGRFADRVPPPPDLPSVPPALEELARADPDAVAARAAVGTVQMALLFAVGRLAFGVSLGPEPWALCLPTVGIVFAGTAFGLVVAATAPSREAVLPLGSIAIMTMAAVGGCWWPIDLEPDWMQRAALAFPTTWAMEAYNDLMIRRQPAGTALGATAVLLAYGAVYLAAGLLLFRRRVMRAA